MPNEPEKTEITADDHENSTRETLVSLCIRPIEYKGQHCALVVDYFSKWISVGKRGLESCTSVINALMTLFTTYSFLDQLKSDNGPQYSRAEFEQFCKENNIVHSTSSSH